MKFNETVSVVSAVLICCRFKNTMARVQRARKVRKALAKK